MSEQQSGSGASAGGYSETSATSVDKGKGKAVDVAQDVSMDDDDSSDEDSGIEEPVEEVEEEDEDNMEEIDTDNIISDGRRTRGKSIDFAKAAQEAGGDEDEDEEDDEDFHDPDDEMKD